MIISKESFINNIDTKVSDITRITISSYAVFHVVDGKIESPAPVFGLNDTESNLKYKNLSELCDRLESEPISVRVIVDTVHDTRYTMVVSNKDEFLTALTEIVRALPAFMLEARKFFH